MDYKELLKYLSEISVLYVEDDPSIREELVFFLEKRVAKLYVGKNGEEGYELFLKENPDLIITDIQMPKMNGIEMSKLIKDFNPNSNIVIITAFNDTDFLFESIELNINSYLTKPLDLQKMLVTIGTIAKNIFLEKENKQAYNIIKQYKEVVDERSIFTKFDKEGYITYVNKPFENISEYSMENILNAKLKISDCLIKDEKILALVWEQIKESRTIWHGKILNTSLNGKEYYLDTLIKPILDLDNQVLEYISLSNDITNLEKTKEYFKNQTEIQTQSLSESIQISNFYKKAINQSNIILKFNTKKEFTYANQLFYEISGFTKDELIGKPYDFLKQVNLEQKERSAEVDEIFSNNIWQGKITNLSKDNQAFSMKVTSVPFENNEGEIIEYLQIRQDITKIENLHKELQDTQREIIYKLGDIAEARSQEVANHVKRVAEYSKLIALKLGLSDEDVNTIFIISPMHDIGKMGIADGILNKPGKLDEDEWEIMKTHSEIGYKLLNSSSRNILKSAAIVSYTHHEKWDGTGYPLGLKGEDIHIFGRITAVADVFDALSTKRVYKEAWTLDDVINFFIEQKGKHFEPRLVDILVGNLDEFLELRDKYKD